MRKYTQEGLIVVSKEDIKNVQKEIKEVGSKGVNELKNYVANKTSLIRSKELVIENNIMTSLLRQIHPEFDTYLFDLTHFIMPYVLLGGFNTQDFPVITRRTIDVVNTRLMNSVERAVVEEFDSAPARTYEYYVNRIGGENPDLVDFCLGISKQTFENGEVQFAGIIKFVHNCEYFREQSRFDRSQRS